MNTLTDPGGLPVASRPQAPTSESALNLGGAVAGRPRRGIALRAVAAQPWAIQREWLQTICEIADGRVDLDAMLAKWEAKGIPTPESRFRHQLGPLDPNRRYDNVRLKDGVAVIEVLGPIFPRANMVGLISETTTSLDQLTLDLQRATESDLVRAILLDIESPGGVAYGLQEMAEEIRAFSGRKPVVAFVSGLAASAAYWIAAACTEIVISRTAILGSVGVVSGAAIQEKPDQNGFRYIDIVSSNAANKRPDVSSEEGLAEAKRTLDALESEFIGAVARYRSLSPAQVIEQFGQGGVRVGQAAIDAGMADRFGTIEGILAELAGLQGNQATAAPATRQNPESHTMTETNTGAPTNSAAAPSSSPAAAVDPVAKERKRALAIQQAAFPGQEKLVQKLIADGTPKSAALTALIADAKTRNLAVTTLQNVRSDATRAAAALPAPAAIVADSGDAFLRLAHMPPKERAQALFALQGEEGASIRAEFATAQRLEGYLQLKADAAEGRIGLRHVAPALAA